MLGVYILLVKERRMFLVLVKKWGRRRFVWLVGYLSIDDFYLLIGRFVGKK